MTELGPVLAGLPDPGHRPASCRRAGRCSRTPRCRASRSRRRSGVVPHVDEAALLESTRKIIADPVDVVVVTTGIGFRGWLDTAEAAGLADELVHRRWPASGWSRAARRRAVRCRRPGCGPTGWRSRRRRPRSPTSCWPRASTTSGSPYNDTARGTTASTTGSPAAGPASIDLEVYRWGPPPDPDLLRDDDRGPRGRRLRRRAVHLGARVRRPGSTELRRLDRTRRRPRAQRRPAGCSSPRSGRSRRSRCRWPASTSWCPSAGGWARSCAW